MKRGWMCFSAALMMPVISLCHLYVTNASYLSASYIALQFLGYLALFSAAFGLVRLVFRSNASALMACAVLWAMMFFGIGSLWNDWLLDNVPSYRTQFALRYILVAMVMLLMAVLFRKDNIKPLPLLSLLMCSALLLMNLFPAARAVAAYSAVGGTLDESKYKTTFSVDATRPSPNIYWLHMDGMMGFQAFERYYGDDQRALVEALEARGFFINKTATFDGCNSTDIAYAALTNPDFYDREMAPRIADEEDRTAMLMDNDFRYDIVRGARLRNELLTALRQKGYASTFLTRMSHHLPPIADVNYIVMDDVDRIDKLAPYIINQSEATRLIQNDMIEVGNVDAVLEETTGWLHLDFAAMIKELTGSKETYATRELTEKLAREQMPEMLSRSEAAAETIPLVQSLNDALNTPAEGPRFITAACFAAHSPFAVNEDGTAATGYDDGDPRRYPGSLRFAGNLMIYLIDMILQKDPDAVIVLQGDHGLHEAPPMQIEELYGAGSTPYFYRQVMSALRVPEAYQNGEESAAMSNPLNQTRYLVNTFVGKQYEYLPEAALES